MALTGTVLSILPTGSSLPVPGGTMVFGPGDVQEPAFVGTYTFIGDGTITTVPVNWIDGTQTIPYTPKAVLVFGIPALSGSADVAGVLRVEGSNAAPRVTALSNTSFSAVYSTSVASGSTASFLFVVYK